MNFLSYWLISLSVIDFTDKQFWCLLVKQMMLFIEPNLFLNVNKILHHSYLG